MHTTFVGYRDDSIREVQKNRTDLQLPLLILSYKDLYGWTMDDIVAKIGKKNNCTFCGVFRFVELQFLNLIFLDVKH